ncbi:MAG: 2-oxo acid dehydrogenase subunit E2 [Legionella sp.]
MDDFQELLRPRWGSEKWIAEGWNKINSDEKVLIKKRLHELFHDGLPFEIKHDKLLYIYSFSLLAQLEVLAIQIPLKFEDKMVSKENKQRMHIQLLDEIFHGLVFTKILYMLCEPYAFPPHYNANIEILCNYVRNEESPQVAVMLLNLIAEGWIEEAFKCYAQQDIAPKIFNVILNDEHRHVCEADLYRDIGLPDSTIMKSKLEYLEEQLLVNFFLQHRYIVASSALLGLQGASQFIQALNTKHHQQLQKINLEPSKKWMAFMHLIQNMLPLIHNYAHLHQEVEMTPLRKLMMMQWDNSSDATMVSQSIINVTCIDFFEKKFPPETLTTLMMQTVSLWLKENELYRCYFHSQKLYQSKEAYVGVVVQLPNCRDHLGTIAFANCHEMSFTELAKAIRDIIPLMVYCYKRREELEQLHPHLKPYEEETLFDFANTVYNYPIPGSPVATISNIGPWAYTYAKSPLFKNEVMKFVMLQVERKQIWNNNSKQFVIQDQLPISISADHRLFDGNTPVPKMLNVAFQHMYKKMLTEQKKSTQEKKTINTPQFVKGIETLLNLNVDFGYLCLSALQTMWADFFAPEDLLASMEAFQTANKMLS